MKMNSMYGAFFVFIIWAVATFLLVYVIGSALKSSVFPDFPNPPTDWPVVIATLLSAFLTALVMAVSIYMSSQKSNDQISAMESQVSAMEKIRIEDARDDKLRALFEMEYFFKLYAPFYDRVAVDLSFVKNVVEDMKEEAISIDEGMNKINFIFDRLIINSFDLPDKVGGFGRLSPELISAYKDLLLANKKIKEELYFLRHTDARLPKTYQDSVAWALSHLNRYFVPMSYHLEKAKRELLNSGNITAYEKWKVGYFIKPHENGFLLESVRYPRFKAWPKEKLSHSSHGWSDKTIKLEVKFEEKSESEIEHVNAERRANKVVKYYLENFFLGKYPVSEIIAPVPRTREFRAWI